MNYKPKIIRTLDEIIQLGHSREMVEKKLGYAPNSIDQGLARGGNEKLYKSILLYKEWAQLKAGTKKPAVTLEDLQIRIRELLLTIDQLTANQAANKSRKT